ncbi:MAG: phytanoyl-CoA dioxygenase family protein [Candidatus Latescibacterota bacterium]|nr:phytanoyl-CoA dioxygenase family protein [Candidatus Latescibacterota bacterium]
MTETTWLAMESQQRQDFDKQGFLILESFFGSEEVRRLCDAADEVVARIQEQKGLPPDSHFQVRNALAHHEVFLDLIDHPRILALVVDAIGWNIQIRTTHLDYRPPYPETLEAGAVGEGRGADHGAGYRNVVWHPDLASPEIFRAPSHDGRLPFMEIKVFYPLFDMTTSDCGNLWLAPGSHRRPFEDLHAMDCKVPMDQALELKLKPGDAVLWRTAVWHCVGPNRSRKTRKIMHVGYHYRWLRPTDYIEQDPELLARCSPVRRQLLGALAPDTDPLGPNSDIAPASQYWQASNDDNVPLRSWAQNQRALVETRG